MHYMQNALQHVNECKYDESAMQLILYRRVLDVWRMKMYENKCRLEETESGSITKEKKAGTRAEPLHGQVMLFLLFIANQHQVRVVTSGWA